MSHVLLVDDDQELCSLLSSWLEQDGFQVESLHDTQSALQRLAVKPLPEAVVLDVMLPDGNGLELLRTLRTTHAGLPVLMLSARGEPTDRILGLELGADDYLSKPCDPRETDGPFESCPAPQPGQRRAPCPSCPAALC
jgi:two-component system response regulator CpxR